MDSGNLLASLWTFESSCHELATRPLLDGRALRGLADALGVLRQIMSATQAADYSAAFLQLEKLTTGQPLNLEEVVTRLRLARTLAQDLVHPLSESETDPRAYWARAGPAR